MRPRDSVWFNLGQSGTSRISIDSRYVLIRISKHPRSPLLGPAFQWIRFSQCRSDLM